MLKVHETTRGDGALRPVFLDLDTGAGILRIRSDEGALPLPVGALDVVMERFGGPLDPGEPLGDVAALDLGGGALLRHVRHLGFGDVIAKDYLVLERTGSEPVVALATTIAGALAHIGRAASARRPEGPR